MTFKTFILILFSGRPEYKIARVSLTIHSTFDLPESSKSDAFISIRVLIRLVRSLGWTKKETPVKSLIVALDNNENGIASDSKFFELNQLSAFTGSNTYANVLASLSVWDSLVVLIQGVLCAFITVPLSVLGYRRTNMALIPRYASQIAGIRAWLIRSQSRQMYDFAPFSNASNWGTLVYQKSGIEIIKVPSIGPLASHMSHVLADRLIVSNPYHEEEVSFFQKTIRVKTIDRLLPKHASFLSKYIQHSHDPAKGVIGFYSHASWIRELEDHGESLFGAPKQEAELLRSIASYCNAAEASYRIIIFTHPRERESSKRVQVTEYYRSIIADTVDFELYLGSDRSSSIFELADVGVGTMSTVLFERLLAGYKTLFYTQDMPFFPVSNSNLSSICAKTEAGLHEAIDRSMLQSKNNFFDQNQLLAYLHDSEFYKNS
jgi:hypothetical protein